MSDDDDFLPGSGKTERAEQTTRNPLPAFLATVGVVGRKDDQNVGSNTEVAGPNEAKPFLQIYDPADLRRAIESLTGQPEPPELFADEVISFEQHLTNEETLRLKRLRAIANGPLSSRRPLLEGSLELIQRVTTLKDCAPHFAQLFELVLRSAHLAMVTGKSLRLPPILLLGDPGIGKTWAMKRLALALGTPFDLFPMNLTDGFRLRGSNTAWKGARPGRIADAMLASVSASPLILLDELDKTPAIDRERPFDVWHSLWEEENAVLFTDDYLEFPIRCDHVLWIASANDTTDLPVSILDRLLVLSIQPPDDEQRRRIVHGLYAEARAKFGDVLADHLSPEIEDALARANPRHASRILALALGFMAAAGRRELSAEDVVAASALAQGQMLSKPIGFLA